MNWENRLKDIFLAGGVIAAMGCSSAQNDNTIPCGNANPDPCICNRPAESALNAALCDEQQACQADGGHIAAPSRIEVDGGRVPGICAAGDGDARAPEYDAPCGNANPDPCICDRPAYDPEMKTLCDEQKACQAEGGVITSQGTRAPDGGLTPSVCSVGDAHVSDATSGGEMGDGGVHD